ncbi:S-adenosyl-L-methionine-dependent methyltransferase [Mycena rosella]|uniref:S-adenosyl-L-methionine-dependent methyltransferase n=1 Tax=Mycena rosella TaxID=1033263 RepID=A0AAD7DAY5_MYCRO|nr:S-adenosyl-L-methionine-dependent methyltransferase [Mycena rosella]
MVSKISHSPRLKGKLISAARKYILSVLVKGVKHGQLRVVEGDGRAKIRHVLAQLRVKAGDRILEIGSGWSGLAIEAARKFGCTVDTVTLSCAQKVLGEARIKAAGLESSVTVHLLDYRCLPRCFEKAFD